MKRVVLWTLASCLLASVALAAESKPFAAPRAAEYVPVSTAGSLAQVTLSLLLVLAAVFAAGWVMRRLRGFGKFQSNAITVIADVSLGTKERAVLVQVGAQQLLLGVAPGRVNTLHVWPEGHGPCPEGNPAGRAAGDGQNQSPGTAFDQAQAPGPTPPARPDFKAILKRSLGL